MRLREADKERKRQSLPFFFSPDAPGSRSSSAHLCFLLWELLHAAPGRRWLLFLSDLEDSHRSTFSWNCLSAPTWHWGLENSWSKSVHTVYGRDVALGKTCQPGQSSPTAVPWQFMYGKALFRLQANHICSPFQTQPSDLHLSLDSSQPLWCTSIILDLMLLCCQTHSEIRFERRQRSGRDASVEICLGSDFKPPSKYRLDQIWKKKKKITFKYLNSIWIRWKKKKDLGWRSEQGNSPVCLVLTRFPRI